MRVEKRVESKDASTAESSAAWTGTRLAEKMVAWKDKKMVVLTAALRDKKKVVTTVVLKVWKMAVQKAAKTVAETVALMAA